MQQHAQLFRPDCTVNCITFISSSSQKESKKQQKAKQIVPSVFNFFPEFYTFFYEANGGGFLKMKQKCGKVA